jgi:hypothetical protein
VEEDCRISQPFVVDVPLARIHAQIAIVSMVALRDEQITWFCGHHTGIDNIQRVAVTTSRNMR